MVLEVFFRRVIQEQIENVKLSKNISQEKRETTFLFSKIILYGLRSIFGNPNIQKVSKQR